MFAPVEAWVCPVCKAGVAPGVSRCDHGGSLATITKIPSLKEGAGDPLPGSPWFDITSSDSAWMNWGGAAIDAEGNWYTWWYDSNGVRHESSGTKSN